MRAWVRAFVCVCVSMGPASNFETTDQIPRNSVRKTFMLAEIHPVPQFLISDSQYG